jgi:hypothetical protein
MSNLTTHNAPEPAIQTRLTGIFSPSIRQKIYAACAFIGVFFGAIQIVYSTALHKDLTGSRAGRRSTGRNSRIARRPPEECGDGPRKQHPVETPIHDRPPGLNSTRMSGVSRTTTATPLVTAVWVGLGCVPGQHFKDPLQ